MATKNQILDMTPLGMTFTVVKTGKDTNGKSLDLHWELLPGCNMKDPLVHTHPNAIETYEILDGEMEFYVKDKWIKAKKGLQDYDVVSDDTNNTAEDIDNYRRNVDVFIKPTRSTEIIAVRVVITPTNISFSDAQGLI